MVYLRQKTAVTLDNVHKIKKSNYRNSKYIKSPNYFIFIDKISL